MIIKVCGMRDSQNIRDVEQLGVDYMGFICVHSSPRWVEHRPAYLPADVQRVGVFVNPSLEEVTYRIKQLELDKIQLHGSEPTAFCKRLFEQCHIPIIKALPIASALDFERAQPYLALACIETLLFDTKNDKAGGSGHKFDWDVLNMYEGNKPFILAGGIGPEDAHAILQIKHPRLCGVDLNSRFETAPAKKDTKLLSNFIKTLRTT